MHENSRPALCWKGRAMMTISRAMQSEPRYTCFSCMPTVLHNKHRFSFPFSQVFVKNRSQKLSDLCRALILILWQNLCQMAWQDRCGSFQRRGCTKVKNKTFARNPVWGLVCAKSFGKRCGWNPVKELVQNPLEKSVKKLRIGTKSVAKSGKNSALGQDMSGQFVEQISVRTLARGFVSDPLFFFVCKKSGEEHLQNPWANQLQNVNQNKMRERVQDPVPTCAVPQRWLNCWFWGAGLSVGARPLFFQKQFQYYGS